MSLRRPDRINLSIGHKCWVSCPGCYSFFGDKPPALSKFARSAARFAALGIPNVTLSGGDPLLVKGLWSFLCELRNEGVKSIKVDTVGTSLGENQPGALEDLLSKIDILSLPLDGWSSTSISWFRRGRPNLFNETCGLLSLLQYHSRCAQVYINTVAHRLNLFRLHEIYQVLKSYRCVDHWNVFQYMPTDQTVAAVNRMFEVGHEDFESARQHFFRWLPSAPTTIHEIEFASVADRLGKYLLINSDGNVWLPDADGRTIRLGVVFDRENEILAAWNEVSARLRSSLTTASSFGTQSMFAAMCS